MKRMVDEKYRTYSAEAAALSGGLEIAMLKTLTF